MEDEAPMVDVHLEDGVVHVQGDLDLASEVAFDKALRAHLALVEDGVVPELDMSEVHFMDSTGIRVLLRVHRDRPFVIGRCSDDAAQRLKMAGLWEHLTA